MSADRKFVALSLHPWTDLSVGRSRGAASALNVTRGPQGSIGFLIVYPSREAAEAAEPGADVIEIGPRGPQEGRN